jgi:hypothetical protein
VRCRQRFVVYDVVVLWLCVLVCVVLYFFFFLFVFSASVHTVLCVCIRRASIGEIDNDLDGSIDLSLVKAEPLPPIFH